MISKQYIKDLEFNTIEEFFNYVLESKVNGAYSQTKKFILQMSKEQFKNFLEWCNFEYIEQSYKDEFLKMRFDL